MPQSTIYNITPVAAPRMTRSDRWRNPRRPCVQKYFDFRDEVKKLNICVPESGAHITFIMPMAPSWAAKKKILWDGKAHQNPPDGDNMLKALLDSIYENDCGVWDIRITKLWGYKGCIKISL